MAISGIYLLLTYVFIITAFVITIFRFIENGKIHAIKVAVREMVAYKQMTKLNIFVDAGDYERTKDPAEIYIRGKAENGEIYDICNFACCELLEPYETAVFICNQLRNAAWRK